MRTVPAAILAMVLPFVPALAQNTARQARIVGAVGDSVSGAPLRGAEVVVSGVAAPVTTVFTGTQLIIVHSPNFELAAAPIVVTSRHPVDVAVKLGPKVKLPDPVLR